MSGSRCHKCGQRVPWLSFAGNLAMTVYKVVVGILGGSSALIADGLHSFTDVIGTSAILFTRKISDQPADSSHPYGHGKAEFIGSGFIYTVLIVLAIAIFSGGALMIIHDSYKIPKFVTMLAAGVSVLYNVLMYQLGSCAGKKNNSPALLANAYENRADAVSSAACIVGIAAAMFIHPICDPIAAMFVGVVILVNSIVQLRESVSGLIDVSMPPQVLERIEKIVLKQENVSSISYIKTRQTGTKFWVDIGIAVPCELNASMAAHTATRVRTELMRRSDRLHHVEVFVSADSARTHAARERDQFDSKLRNLLRKLLHKKQEEVTDAS